MYRQHEGIRTGRYMQYIQPSALGGTATVILPKTPSAEVQTRCVPVNGTAGPPWRQRGESWQMRTIMGRTCDPLRAVYAASRNTHPSCRHHPVHPWTPQNARRSPQYVQHSSGSTRARLCSTATQVTETRRRASLRASALRVVPADAHAAVVARPCDANPIQFKRASSRGRASRTRLSHASLNEWSSLLLARAGR